MASGFPLSSYMFRAVGVLALAGAAFVLATGLITAGKSPTHTFELRLAGQPAPGDLEETVETLRARLQALKSDYALLKRTVRARPPDRVELSFKRPWSPDRQQAQRSVESLTAWLTLQGHIEFRLVHPRREPPAGEAELPEGYEMKAYRARQYILSHPGDLETVEKQYLLRRDPALKVEQLKGATIETTGLHKMAVVTFEFMEPDAESFAKLTALHVGRQVAMLVDGEMFLPPREVERPVTGGSVQARGFFYLPPLRTLVKVLNTGPLPAPLRRISHSVE